MQDKRTIPLEHLPPRLRVDQVASFLNVTDDHVLNLIKSRALAAVDISTGPKRHFRVAREALENFVKSRIVEA
jgi:excisionase family DNA binding protein